MTDRRSTPPPTYWYAPFDNAGELVLAEATAPALDGGLVVQSCAARFGEALPTPPDLPFALQRDLPAPAGEDGGSRSPWARWRVAAQRARLRRDLVTRTRPGLLHLHTYNVFTDWYAIERLKAPGRPVVQSIHNVRPHDSPLPEGVERRLLRRGYAAPDHLVVAHDRLATELVDGFGVPCERITVIPLPAVPDEFDPRPPEGRRTGTTFLFFGTFRRNKGIHVLLAAIEAMRDEPDLRFVFAGRGDPDVEEAVRDAAAGDQRITAEIGFVEADRRSALYRDADVVVLPYTEMPAQSGVLHDAYGASRACIAADVGPLGATVREEGTGWVCRPGDAAGLVVVLRTAAADVDGRDARARRAAAICADRVPERVAARFVELYEGVTARSRAG